VTEAFDHPTPGARPGFAPGQSRLAPTRAAAQPVADRSGELDASRLASMSDEEVELLLKQQELLLRGQSKNE
jgi:hypothetical protein